MRDSSAFDLLDFVDNAIESALFLRAVELLNDKRNQICAEFNSHFHEAISSFQPVCLKQFFDCEWQADFFSQLKDIDVMISKMTEEDAQITHLSFTILKNKIKVLDEISKNRIRKDGAPIFFRILHDDYVQVFPDASFKLFEECLSKLELFYKSSYAVESNSPQIAIDLQSHMRVIDRLFEEYHRTDITSERRAELKELLKREKTWVETALSDVKQMCKDAALGIERTSPNLQYMPTGEQNTSQQFKRWYENNINPRSVLLYPGFLVRPACSSSAQTDSAPRAAASAPGH